VAHNTQVAAAQLKVNTLIEQLAQAPRALEKLWASL
jgi:hypothetical protein